MAQKRTEIEDYLESLKAFGELMRALRATGRYAMGVSPEAPRERIRGSVREIIERAQKRMQAQSQPGDNPGNTQSIVGLVRERFPRPFQFIGGVREQQEINPVEQEKRDREAEMQRQKDELKRKEEERARVEAEKLKKSMNMSVSIDV